MLVDFMIIGAQKCGTTSLADQLAQHPEICFSRIKEPGYFSFEQEWERGLDEYHALFSPRPGQLCGEGSTWYTFFPEFGCTAERLYQYNPRLKLIYIMRNPVERIVSNYAHDLLLGTVKSSPEEAILADPGYVLRSRYAVQIRPYLELFGRDQLQLLIFEDYIANPQVALGNIARFLDVAVDHAHQLAPLHSHRSAGATQLRGELMRSTARSEWFQSVRQYVPTSVRKPIRSLLARKLDEKPEFTVELKKTLWRLVEDDVYWVEKLMGRSLEEWHFDHE